LVAVAVRRVRASSLKRKKERLAEKVKTRVIGNTDLVANLSTGTGSTVSS
jgi:hypothetical protein